MWPVQPVWFLDATSTTSESVVLAAALLAVWRYRRTAPVAFQVFVAALVLTALSTAMTDLERIFPRQLRYTPAALHVNNWGDVVRRHLDADMLAFMAWKGFKAACRIAAWSLLAWAVLKRPDDLRRAEPVSG